MLKFEQFSGINNVQPGHRLKPTELATATNVDVGLSGEVRRRQGYSLVSALCHKNLWQADGFMLATYNGDLAHTDGTNISVLSPSLGVDRVWYCNLPDGRTTFSNGLINGVTDGVTTTALGVSIPDGVGVATPVSGELDAGEYRWAVTHVRLSDGLEGGAAYSEPAALPEGGLLLTALPLLDDHQTNVYLSNGEAFFFAGTAAGSSFGFLGANDSLVLPLRTDQIYPMPVGTVTAFWRGRLLVARGNVLWASLPNNWEHCDVRRDYKLFEKPITLIQPVDDGVYVGTTGELAFLGGEQFDRLEYRQVVAEPTVLGSGVQVAAEYLKPREGGSARGTAMICIAGGGIVYGYNGGGIWRLTDTYYKTAVAEVVATWRLIDGVPQYLAVPV